MSSKSVYSRLLIVVSAAFLFLAVSTFAATEDKEPKGPSPTEGMDNLDYIKGRGLVLDGKYGDALPFMERALKADPENPLINYQMSEIHMRLGNYEAGESMARKAVEKDPENLEYRATLGGILASVKKYPEAKEQYAFIMQKEPTNQKAPLLLGLLEAESGQMEEGVKVLSKAIDASSENFMALFYRAKIYLEMEQIPKAKEDLERVIVLRPNLVEAGTALGLIYERLGQTEDAIKAYEKIQGSGRFKKRLAQLYLAKNDLDRALEQLLDYEKEEPDDYTARVKIGLIYFEHKQYDLAQKKFSQILKEAPDADNVRFYLGAVYEETKQGDKAIAEFKKVSKESNFFREAMLHVGFIYKDKAKLGEGLTFAAKLAKENPTVPEFIDLHASFYEAQKDYKKAIGVVSAGLKIHPTDERLMYFEGALSDKVGDRRKAIEIMKKIIAANAENAHALNFLGYVYSELNENLDEAQGYVERALKLRPNDGYIEDSMGWILFKKGQVDEAIAKLEHAHSLQPEEAIILEHLGDAYHAKKNYAKAEESYRKAVAVTDKKDKEAQKKLAAKLAGLTTEPRNPTQAP